MYTSLSTHPSGHILFYCFLGDFSFLNHDKDRYMLYYVITNKVNFHRNSYVYNMFTDYEFIYQYYVNNGLNNGN